MEKLKSISIEGNMFFFSTSDFMFNAIQYCLKQKQQQPKWQIRKIKIRIKNRLRSMTYCVYNKSNGKCDDDNDNDRML